MANRFTELPDMSFWSQSIGGLIINFGIAEFLTLRCVEKCLGRQAAFDIRNKKLSGRIDVAKSALAASRLSPEQMKRSDELWSEISVLSRTRNRIAHNPLCPGVHPATNRVVWSVIDLKKMVPVGENRLEPLDYAKITAVALRVRDITRELSSLIEAVPV